MLIVEEFLLSGDLMATYRFLRISCKSLQGLFSRFGRTGRPPGDLKQIIFIC